MNNKTTPSLQERVDNSNNYHKSCAARDGCLSLTEVRLINDLNTALQSEQAKNKRLTDDEDIIEERDAWEEKATKLAELCGTLLNVDVGEHSNCNCPVDVAIEEVEIAINNNETLNAN